MSDPHTPRNPPASAMAEPAPRHERAIRSKLDAAVDATFPASDPIAMEDPARRRREPVLPADARPGDVLGDSRRPQRRAFARHREPEIASVLRWVWPWAIAGIALQAWWIGRRR